LANIYDVAKEAGVSKSTVSRVINKHPNVNQDKRERVLAAMKKLDYTPNSAARNLAGKRKNTIGVFITELSDTFYGVYLRDVSYFLNTKYHYGALYCTMNKNVSIHVDYLKLMNKNVDGYIFIGEGTISNKRIRKLIDNGEAVATIGVGQKHDGAISVEVNNEEASYVAVKYLAELGHKNILHISFIDHKKEFMYRREGYFKAVKDYKLTYNEIIEISYDYEDAFELGVKLSKNIKDKDINCPSAAFCVNDSVAVGLIDGLQWKGVKIPEEFSIIGFDDIDMIHRTKTLIPPLTTLHQPQNEMTEYAVKNLYEKIENKKKEAYKVFNCDLIVRQTTMKCNN